MEFAGVVDIFCLMILLTLTYSFFSGRSIGLSNLFLFGVVYYIVIPYYVYRFNAFDGLPGIDVWKGYFSTSFLRYELLVFYFAFCAFTIIFLEKLMSKVKVNFRKKITIGNVGAYASLFFLAFFGTYLWMKAYSLNMLFSGYLATYDTGLMGNMATMNLFANFLSIYFILESRKTVGRLILCFVIVNSVFLLSMGGRMYVVTVLVPWMVMFMQRRRLIKDRVYLFFVLSIFVIVMGCVGIFRLGGQSFTLLGYMVFAEPIFTSVSTASYLSLNDEIPFLENGLFFLSSFSGILPSFIFPDKLALLPSPSSFGYSYESPFGATSLVVSLFTSFGYVGGVLFFAFISFFTSMVRKLGRCNSFFGAYYLCLISIVPFLFFRESFFLSNRVIVFPYFIMPVIIYFFDRGVRRFVFSSK